MCTTSPIGTDDETAIRTLEKAYDDAWSAGDIRALVASFSPEAVVVNPFGEIARGRAQIEHVLREFLDGPARGSRHTSIVSKVEFVTDNVAIVDGEATLDGLPSSGEPKPPLVHRFTDILVKRDGTWFITQVRAYVFMTRGS